MTLEEFIEKYNYAPLDIEEVAQIAIKVDGEVGKAARDFLEVRGKFNNILEKNGFELG